MAYFAALGVEIFYSYSLDSKIVKHKNNVRKLEGRLIKSNSGEGV